MIIFLGCSFTWGQGLQIEKWLKEGKSKEYCNKYMPPNYPAEKYSYEDDKYRKENHFPALVAKHFDKSYVTKFGNGGSNEQIIHHLNNLKNHMDIDGIDFVVIQFTEVTRDMVVNDLETYGGDIPFDEYVKNHIEKQVDWIDKFCKNGIKRKWFGFSWQKDFGELLETKYKENYIPLTYKNQDYNNFDDIFGTPEHDLTFQRSHDLHDGHFNSKGHRVIADSIIKKITPYL
jgi:hypothetical protein